jgi:DNA-binding beta-propeller fold protein YncE
MDEKKLCDAGTIDNTVAIVSTSNLAVLATANVGLMPYWATTSADGKYCFVSLSGDDAISVVSYRTGREVARVAVGNFPQRNRIAKVPEKFLQLLSASPG